MLIRKARPQELDTLMDLFAYARRFMTDHGNPNQWSSTNWPPRNLIADDISRGKSYVCEHDGSIAATFFYDFGQDVEPTYAYIENGSWLSDSPYGVVHRIASSHIVPGAGTACLNWAFEQSGHVRIDTHFDNYVMRGLLEKLGYSHLGTIFVNEYRSPRMAFEKVFVG